MRILPHGALAPGASVGDTPRVTDPAEAGGACALCGRPGTTLHSQLGDRLFDVPGEWSLRSCTGCSLVWLDPMPSEDQLAAFYDDYYTHQDTHQDAHHDISHDAQEDDPAEASWFRRAVTLGIPAARMGYVEAPSTTTAEQWAARGLAWIGPLREVAEHGVMWLPTSRRGLLLDVGCGSGVFLERMRNFGWRIAGVEPDAKARQAAAHRLGPGVTVAASLADEALGDASFDAITLSHVIEHVPDPVATLRDCARLLAPSGTITCVTPNTKGLGRRSFGKSWIHWDPPRHLHLFEPETLGRAFIDAGLEVSHTETPGSTAHYVWQASATLERRGRVPGGQPTRVSPALWLESLGFWAIEYVLTRLGRRCGEEVLVVGSKTRA